MIKIHLTLIVALFALAGCSNNGDTPIDKPQAPTSVSFSATKSDSGFGASSGFVSGSQIGVYITTANAGLKSSGNHVHNAIFTSSGSGFTSTGTVFPSGIESLDFYAYSPYSSTSIDASNKITFTTEATQTTPENSDLLWAYKAAVPTATTSALVFDHKMSQIVVKLKADAGVALSSPTVNVVGALPSVKMNVETGALDAAQGVVRNIIPTTIASDEMHAIIVPQTIALGTDFILVQNGAKSFKYTLPKSQTFASGLSYLFTITVKDNAIDVDFTGSVNGWNEGDVTTGDAV